MRCQTAGGGTRLRSLLLSLALFPALAIDCGERPERKVRVVVNGERPRPLATMPPTRQTFQLRNSDMEDLAARFSEEVADLHRFFEDWFHGRSDRHIEEFADRLDDRFTIVAPNGHVLGKDDIVHLVEGRFEGDDVAITTSHSSVTLTEPVIVGAYQEHHSFRGETTSRIATAVMARDASVQTGFRWLSVHETWITEEV